MRSTTVKGLDDGLRIELGGDTGIIEYVMDIGKGIDYLIYQAEMTGAELLEFMRKFRIDEKLYKDVKEENKYTVTSYDW